jgi:plastocyanin
VVVRRWRRGPVVAVLLSVLATGCTEPDPRLVPDERLRSELGLGDADRVHSVAVETGTSERAAPDSLAVLVGDYVQFVSNDWMVHEVRFELDSLAGAGRAFLERTGQTGSPPLLQRDARFVLTFADAPPGRYPYRLVGNRAEGAGVIVVVSAGGP